MGKLKKLSMEDDRDRVHMEAKNIVVFGESGVGKSSLINLIAGRTVSETSSDAIGCTLEYKRYLIDLDDQPYAIWDTAGLDEGSMGSVPADKAEAYLKRLLHELARSNGVHLLVYCVRGTRVRSALLTNYHIFYSAICRRKVPIAIAITGLENQEGSMETWWYSNAPQFTSLKMFFDGHACVTTLEASAENPTLARRRELSREVVIKMITSVCRTQQWKPPERSWIESAYSDVRALLSPRRGANSRLPTIIMCETHRTYRRERQLNRRRSFSFQSPLSLNPVGIRNPLSFSDSTSRRKLPFEQGVKCTPERLYRVYQVSPERPESEEEPNQDPIVKRGANLLIFCVNAVETAPRAVKPQWDYFNLTYGGDLSPQIVVVIGAPDQSSAEEWWKRTVGGSAAANDVRVAYYPYGIYGVGVEAAQRRLQRLINERCIDFSRLAFARNENPFRRSLRVEMSGLPSLWGKSESSSMEDGLHGHEQDILTRVGVWSEMERSPTSPTSPKESLLHFF